MIRCGDELAVRADLQNTCVSQSRACPAPHPSPTSRPCSFLGAGARVGIVGVSCSVRKLKVNVLESRKPLGGGAPKPGPTHSSAGTQGVHDGVAAVVATGSLGQPRDTRGGGVSGPSAASEVTTRGEKTSAAQQSTSRY